MDFEFIDEDEVVSCRGERKIKKTPSLFDTPIEERTYWGGDAGTELLMVFSRRLIRKSIKNLRLINLETNDYVARLNKEYREELRIYQLEMLRIMITQDSYTIRQLDDGDYEIVILPRYQNIDDLYVTNDSE